jgi:hypothetical protein
LAYKGVRGTVVPARTSFLFALRPEGVRFHGGNPVSPVGPLVGVHKCNEAGKAGLS